jgi:hypothetical protein
VVDGLMMGMDIDTEAVASPTSFKVLTHVLDDTTTRLVDI